MFNVEGTKFWQLKFNRRWHIFTTPNTTQNFWTLFKLIQPSDMVTLSCLAKKNPKLNLRKKSSVYYWKWRFPKVCGLKTQLSVINWTFFFGFIFRFFFRKATQGDHIRWNNVQFFWLCWELWLLMCHFLLNEIWFLKIPYNKGQCKLFWNSSWGHKLKVNWFWNILLCLNLPKSQQNFFKDFWPSL